MTEQTLTEPIDQRQDQQPNAARAVPRLFTLPGDPRCAAGAGPVHDHHRFHDHVAARRHHHAGLDISAAQFEVAVSAYAFSAGVSGILAAGFADRFDRKWLLLFFYVGLPSERRFARSLPPYHVLLFKRIVIGLFGGVIGSVVLAIVTDVFALNCAAA